jgi:guanylate kinase
MRDGGELLEWAEVFGNFYGTPRAPVEAALAAGRDVLFDIDWQGARQIRESAPADLASVFILPPSAGELRHRLETRAEDTADVIARRLKGAIAEIVHWDEYDYVIVTTRSRSRSMSFARSWSPSASGPGAARSWRPGWSACAGTSPAGPRRLSARGIGPA